MILKKFPRVLPSRENVKTAFKVLGVISTLGFSNQVLATPKSIDIFPDPVVSPADIGETTTGMVKNVLSLESDTTKPKIKVEEIETNDLEQRRKEVSDKLMTLKDLCQITAYSDPSNPQGIKNAKEAQNRRNELIKDLVTNYFRQSDIRKVKVVIPGRNGYPTNFSTFYDELVTYGGSNVFTEITDLKFFEDPTDNTWRLKAITLR